MDQDGDVTLMVGYQLKRAQAALRGTMDEALRPLGLTTPQYSCLVSLSRNPGASNADLARDVFVTRQTMNTILRTLLDRGLVERPNRAPTGRALPLTLTDAGRVLLDQAEELVEQIEGEMVKNLDKSQIRDLLQALAQCADNLTEVTEN